MDEERHTMGTLIKNNSLCYTAATNTTMQSNYTPTEMLKK